MKRPPKSSPPAPARYYVATCGDGAAMRTGCMVAVAFYACPLAYGRAIRAARAEHERGELDSYTYGDVRPD